MSIRRRDKLMEQANHEDGVLQAYRSVVLTVQSILLASAAALVAAQYQVLDKPHGWILLFAVFVIAASSLYALDRIYVLLTFKGREVAYFQREVLRSELALDPADQVFYAYKCFQRKLKVGESPLREEDIDKLVPLDGPPSANTKRAAITGLFFLLELAWVVLMVAGLWGVVPQDSMKRVCEAVSSAGSCTRGASS